MYVIRRIVHKKPCAELCEVMPADVQADESNGGPLSKTFIVWMVLEKPHRYLYDRLWKAGGRVLKTSLSNEDEAKLQAALSAATSS